MFANVVLLIGVIAALCGVFIGKSPPVWLGKLYDILSRGALGIAASSFLFFALLIYNAEAVAVGSHFLPAGVVMEGTEREWGYGQILPILLLTLPVLSALEIYNGKRTGLCKNMS